jgi:tRNA nucleotidyltransferase (CCA-adding enzyme)
MFYYTEQWTDGAVRRFIKNVGVENLEDLFELREADRKGNGMKMGIPEAFLNFKDRIKKIFEIDNAFKIRDLDINGDILMKELAIPSGPMIGEILNFLLELVLDDPELNDKTRLIEKAKEYYEKKKNYSMEQYGERPENLGSF